MYPLCSEGSVKEKREHIFVYVDGASKGNPGPAGIGVFICDNSNGKSAGAALKRVSKPVGILTNNAAEYLALIYGLQEALMLEAKRITLYSDSELVTKQLNREYKVKDKELKPFYFIAMHLVDNLSGLEIRHIPREENKIADNLADEAVESLF